jgi:hypothetical protein
MSLTHEKMIPMSTVYPRFQHDRVDFLLIFSPINIYKKTGCIGMELEVAKL